MTALRVLLSRFVNLFRRGRMEADLDRELQFHLQMEIERHVQAGMSPQDARRIALKRFGGMAQTKESYRATGGLPFLETLLQDIRYAARSLRRQPGFTAVAVLTLAVGIGANTAIYTVVDATLLRSLPYRDPDRLMRVSLVVYAQPGTQLTGNDDSVWSYPKYEAFRKMQHSFEDTALYRTTAFDLAPADPPEHLLGERVSASYFPLLGVQAELGRTFRPEEDVTIGKDFVALLSHSLWVSHYGGDRGILGKTISLGQRSYTVVGVLPDGFQGLGGPADVWVPVHSDLPQQLNQPFLHSFQQVARLRPGVSAEQAKAEVATLGPHIADGFPGPAFLKNGGAKARTFGEARLDGSIRKAVLVLFGAVTCVLLIATANLANLLLARASTRRREVAIRLAVGATGSRIVRHLLTESLLLAGMGAAAGLVLAYAGLFALNRINPANGHIFAINQMPGLTVLGLSSIHLDARALLFTLGVALAAGILFGLAPAFEGARADVADSLKRGAVRPASAGLLTGKSVLVVAEVALAMVLLTGAGLMMKGFVRLVAARTGVNPDQVLTVQIDGPVRRRAPEQGPSSANGGLPRDFGVPASLFFDQLEQRVSTLPGVVAAGSGDCHALAGRCSSTTMRFPDRPAVVVPDQPPIDVHWASPGYFRTMQIPLVRGRWFAESDSRDAPRVAVISEEAARRYWPGEDPIGKPMGLGMSGWDRAEVIGVVGDVRYGQVDEPMQPAAYVSHLQQPQTRLLLFVRTASNPLSLVDAVRREVRALDRNATLYDIKTMNERIADATSRTRFSAILLAVFAAIALALAGIGIYGVMSYMVRQRTREIGIRMALGARGEDVRSMVVRRAVALTAIGIAIGLVGAFAATRVLGNLLYEVKPGDPATYLLVSTLLGALALLAGYLPARRATQVDPCVVLRAE
ncbi:MAG: ABC transporter permease [Acidobacteriia bacterium]|nr:ABC transporter permease [Terriglobia bacterium]